MRFRPASESAQTGQASSWCFSSSVTTDALREFNAEKMILILTQAIAAANGAPLLLK
jgi:hypothetical protein